MTATRGTPIESGMPSGLRPNMATVGREGEKLGGQHSVFGGGTTGRQKEFLKARRLISDHINGMLSMPARTNEAQNLSRRQNSATLR